MLPQYELEKRTCGCGISFRVLPTSEQYCCGRTACETSQKILKMTTKEKRKAFCKPFISEPKKSTSLVSVDAMQALNRKDATWEDCVSAAKVCVVRLTQYRMLIASLALKACEVRHGGGGHWNGFADYKTITAFAKEIGIHRKTLSEWISHKRNVVDKLQPGEVDPTNWKLLRRVNTELRRSAGTTMLQTTKDLDAAFVRKIYDREKNRCQEGEEITTFLKYIKTYHHKINNQWKLKKTYHEELAMIHSRLTEITELLEDNVPLCKKQARKRNLNARS